MPETVNPSRIEPELQRKVLAALRAAQTTVAELRAGQVDIEDACETLSFNIGRAQRAVEFPLGGGSPA